MENACIICKWYVDEKCEIDVDGFDYDDEGQPFCIDYEPKELDTKKSN